jgi:hypothetical protein
MNLARHLGGGRRVIDQCRTGAHRVERAVGAKDDRAHVVVIADAHQYDLGVLRRRRGCGRALALVLGEPARDFRGRTVVDGDPVPGFRQMPGHG